MARSFLPLLKRVIWDNGSAKARQGLIRRYTRDSKSMDEVRAISIAQVPLNDTSDVQDLLFEKPDILQKARDVLKVEKWIDNLLKTRKMRQRQPGEGYHAWMNRSGAAHRPRDHAMYHHYTEAALLLAMLPNLQIIQLRTQGPQCWTESFAGRLFNDARADLSLLPSIKSVSLINNDPEVIHTIVTHGLAEDLQKERGWKFVVLKLQECTHSNGPKRGLLLRGSPSLAEDQESMSRLLALAGVPSR